MGDKSLGISVGRSFWALKGLRAGPVSSEHTKGVRNRDEKKKEKKLVAFSRIVILVRNPRTFFIRFDNNFKFSIES